MAEEDIFFQGILYKKLDEGFEETRESKENNQYCVSNSSFLWINFIKRITFGTKSAICKVKYVMFNHAMTLNQRTMVDYGFFTSHQLLVLFSDDCGHDELVCMFKIPEKKCRLTGRLTKCMKVKHNVGEILAIDLKFLRLYCFWECSILPKKLC